MTTQYTPTLKLALPITGELSGTWGDVINDNITSMIEQAIAGLTTINTWTGNAHTLTTADGTTSESRCAMIVAATGTGGTAITAAGQIICPAAAKLYVLQNTTAFAITLKTSAGTGVAVAASNTAYLFCDGTNVNACVTTIVDGNITGNLTVSGDATVNGNTTIGNADTDTITQAASYVTGTQLKSAKTATNTLNLAAYDVDGTAYTNLVTLTASNTPTLALTSTGVGTINNMSVGATTASTGAFTTLSASGTTTLSSALTYGGVTLSNAVTGTGNMALSASPTFTGTAGFANVTASGTLGVTSTSTFTGAATFTGAIVNDSITDSTSTITGAIQTDGGLGVAKALWVGGLANITGVATFTAQPILSSLTASRAVFSDASKGLVSNAITGTGDVVMSNSPTLVTPALGTPASGTVTNLTGTASININGTVGATTPATASVTTLTTSSTVTHNGGTANGVSYLNASKVLTTGSALTFDGTTLTASSGGSTPALKLYGAAVSQGQLQFSSTTGYGIQGGPDYTGLVYNVAASSYQHIFNIGGSEQMRLTSTGLGIGTSSPAVKLDVNGVGGALSAVNPPLQVWDTTALAANVGGGIAFGGNYTGSTKTNWAGIAGLKENATDNNYSGYLAFYTRTNGSGNAERARIDSSGRFIVGASSASGSNQVEIQTSLTNGLWVQTGLTSSANFVADFRTGTNASVLALRADNTALISGDLLVGATSANGKVTVAGTVGILVNPGTYTFDTSPTGTTIADGGTVNYSNASGFLIVNNWVQGTVGIWLMGGGANALVSSTFSIGLGNVAYNPGINGYTWTSNYGAASVYNFVFIRTRPAA